MSLLGTALLRKYEQNQIFNRNFCLPNAVQIKRGNFGLGKCKLLVRQCASLLRKHGYPVGHFYKAGKYDCLFKIKSYFSNHLIIKCSNLQLLK